MKLRLLTALAIMISSPVLAADCPAEARKISEAEVRAAQQDWGEGIVNIGGAEDPEARASELLDTLYAYDLGDVLFKPTLAAADQFRGAKEEALSYFVGGAIPEDKGFALAPYTNVRFDNTGIVTDCDSALAMGNYFFTTTEGEEVKVEYSFGYVKDAAGDLKINLHHSSLPYSPE